MTKRELRKIYLAKQKEISSGERIAKSRAICERFFQNFDFNAVKILHCFLPIEKFNEIDTNFIFEKIWRDFPHVGTVVPRVDFATFEMKSLIYQSETELRQNAWEIHEPIHDRSVETKEIDAVLIPLLCFDTDGFRVGYGKGFYDRFLRECRADCVKIGLSYFAPIEKIVDAEDFDARLDFCITPERVFNYPQTNTDSHRF